MPFKIQDSSCHERSDAPIPSKYMRHALPLNGLGDGGNLDNEIEYRIACPIWASDLPQGRSQLPPVCAPLPDQVA